MIGGLHPAGQTGHTCACAYAGCHACNELSVGDQEWTAIDSLQCTSSATAFTRALARSLELELHGRARLENWLDRLGDQLLVLRVGLVDLVRIRVFEINHRAKVEVATGRREARIVVA